MRSRALAALLAACLLTALPVAAQASSAPTAPAAFSGGGSVRGDLGAARADALETAAATLAAHAAALGVDAGAFGFDTVQATPVGEVVRGRQLRDGVAIDGTTALVAIVGDRVWQVDAHGSDLPGRPVRAPISRATAEQRAVALVGAQQLLAAPVAERLLVAVGNRLVDTWRIHVLGAGQAGTVDLAAMDARVLAVRDTRQYADATATLFDPNPLVTARSTAIRQPGELKLPADADLDSAELTAQLKNLPVRDYDSTQAARGRIVGPWVDVYGPGPVVALDNKIGVTRGDPRFESVMAYAHLDRLQRYFQSLGFTGNKGANAASQWVLALPIQGYDNSFYMPAYDVIAFGAGGVDDGEDAEVILHEYGHAVHDAQVKGWGATSEGGAMGEGFGDFLAAAYYARDISGGFNDLCVAEWDATSYSSANPPCLRRLDTTKQYPKDIRNQVHADGELWSATLWRLRQSLYDPEDPTPIEHQRTDKVLRLLLTSHTFLTPQARFGHAVAALRTAADALGHPEWKALVDAAAKGNSLPLNP